MFRAKILNISIHFHLISTSIINNISCQHHGSHITSLSRLSANNVGDLYFTRRALPGHHTSKHTKTATPTSSTTTKSIKKSSANFYVQTTSAAATARTQPRSLYIHPRRCSSTSPSRHHRRIFLRSLNPLVPPCRITLPSSTHIAPLNLPRNPPFT